MTRDECFSAISTAYGGSHAWAKVGHWDIKVDSNPPRTIVLAGKFVNDAILGGGMTEDSFTEYLLAIPDSQWVKDGSQLLLLIKGE